MTAWLGLVCATMQISKHDTVPERLRGWTRNPVGSARRGSSPLGVVSHGAWTLRMFLMWSVSDKCAWPSSLS